MGLHAQVRQDSTVPPGQGSVRLIAPPPTRPNPHLLPASPEHLRTAFKDDKAATLLAGTRRARREQDAELLNYEANGYQRLSVNLSLSARGRERLAFRREGAIRVRWFQDGVALVDVEGARAVVPIMSSDEISSGANSLARRNMVSGSLQLPYYPGRDELWFGEGIPDANQLNFVHPFADGAESRYKYATGDSSRYTLPDGSVIRLVELLVTPRTPEWFLIAGSFWFDEASNRMVRATYRPVVGMSYWEVVEDNDWQRIPGILRPLLTPLRGTVQSISIEYGLFEGKFWLPRVQTMTAIGEAAMMRLPLTFEQRYDYTGINTTFETPTLPIPTVRCDSSNNRSQLRRRFGGSVRVMTTVTCDVQKLQNSPALPGSIYSEEEAASAAAARNQLERLFDKQLQASFAPRLPSIHIGFADGLVRYNRVEGFSPGAGLLQQIGGGFHLEAVARMGTADRVLNSELALLHGNGSSTLRLGGYRRLSAANDWGAPLSLGSSVQSLAFGRDEGLYYRATGAELIASGSGNPSLEFKLYHELQSAAVVQTSFSIFGGLNEPNISAERGTTTGALVWLHHSLGTEPDRFRLLTDLRAEHGMGYHSFGRAALDVTASRGLLGVMSAAVTLSAGSSVGQLPVQRAFYLGGTQSVRGQAPAAMSGDAFWMARAELGLAAVTVKPLVFADAGWAGARQSWNRQSRTVTGAGAGLSLFDGAIRLDLARGLFPGSGWRFASYFEGRL
jgi:hypothetical protein